MAPQNFRTIYWNPPLKSGLMGYRTVHILRPTNAAHLLQHGESLTYVKARLGHSSVRIAVDTYRRFVPGSNRLAIDRLDEDDPQARHK